MAERDPRSTGLRAQPRPANQRPRGGDPSPSYSYLYPYFGWGPYSTFDYYNPRYYGVGGWGWDRWGYGYNTWHDPFLYGSYYTAYPYYWGNLSDRESWAKDDDARQGEPSGALRLRVSPREAKVYVDGALAGIVDEFDGLANHLRLPAGPHQIEFRADGYETVTLAVTVQNGKTRTERASLKRK